MYSWQLTSFGMMVNLDLNGYQWIMFKEIMHAHSLYYALMANKRTINFNNVYIALGGLACSNKVALWIVFQYHRVIGQISDFYNFKSLKAAKKRDFWTWTITILGATTAQNQHISSYIKVFILFCPIITLSGSTMYCNCCSTKSQLVHHRYHGLNSPKFCCNRCTVASTFFGRTFCPFQPTVTRRRYLS